MPSRRLCLKSVLDRSSVVRCALLVLLAIALVALAPGCVKVKDTITLNPDGSGSVEIETVCYVNELVQMSSMRYGYGRSTNDPYPPLAKRDASLLFPAKDFTVKTEQTRDQGQSTLVIRADFKDVNRLLASPYARAHSLWMALDPDGKTLTVKALSGLQYLPDLASLQKGSGRAVPENYSKKMQEQADKLRVDFALKLPAPVKAPGAVVDGNSASWTVDHAVIKDSAALAEAFRQTMTASCSAEALQFKPVSPVRLDLGSFADVLEGPVGPKAAPVDSAKVLAAAKIVPLRFQATRSYYFTDESSGNRDTAVLVALVTLPRSLAPLAWGKADVLEVADDTGANLLASKDDLRYNSWNNLGSYSSGRTDEKPDADVQHVVALPMKSPLPTAKALKQLRASLLMTYPGDEYVFKIKDAVEMPPLQEETEGRRVIRNYEDADKTLSHPSLDKFGFKITVSNVYYQPDSGPFSGGSTSITLQCSGSNALLRNVQVYDAKGKPCPTSFSNQGGDPDQENLYLTVMGHPDGPLSLSLLINGGPEGGSSVKLPISLRDVPIVPNEPPRSSTPAPVPAPDAPLVE